MKLRTTTIVIASLAPLAGIHAATLLTPGSTQMLYTLGESGADFSTNFTDASGNNRNMVDGTPRARLGPVEASHQAARQV